MRTLEFTVGTAEKCVQRADVYIAEKSGISRSRVRNLCEDGLCFVNGKAVKSNKTLNAGDKITVNVPDEKNLDVVPENLPLDIIYQDDDLAVINKSQGMTVHAGNGVSGGTLVNALLYHLDKLSGINGVIRPGIVHRIDKNTSGLLVVAKNDRAHVALSKQLADKTCRRVYVALLEGNLKQDEGTVDTFIGRNPADRTKMAVLNVGRRAITSFKVLERFNGYTLCEFSLKTGRTHQIRVHAKHLGHPVVGDAEYGYKNRKFRLNGQLLHAKTLEFVHPTTGEKMSFSAPLPDYFENVLNVLRNKNKI
ncbi:MAG: RluA family pseudouridine synthase [Clostridia bacterium]|nr:RluA family pseudouridine synthase [Clostridia bacterium]